MKEHHYECSFCHSKFVQESRYLKHHCKEMKRDEEFRTPNGQAAWLFYQKWMKAYRRMIPNPESYLKSRYYQAFARFAKLTKTLHFPDVDAFIRLMKENDISPTIWNNDQVYAMYIEYLDRRTTPLQQARTTIDTLFSVSEKLECDIGDIFDNIHANEIITLLRERRISPWILLFSKKFMVILQHRASPEQRIIIESIVRPQYWTKKFNNHPEEVQLMKKYVEELNI